MCGVGSWTVQLHGSASLTSDFFQIEFNVHHDIGGSLFYTTVWSMYYRLEKLNEP